MLPNNPHIQLRHSANFLQERSKPVVDVFSIDQSSVVRAKSTTQIDGFADVVATSIEDFIDPCMSWQPIQAALKIPVRGCEMLGAGLTAFE